MLGRGTDQWTRILRQTETSCMERATLSRQHAKLMPMLLAAVAFGIQSQRACIKIGTIVSGSR